MDAAAQSWRCAGHRHIERSGQGREVIPHSLGQGHARAKAFGSGASLQLPRSEYLIAAFRGSRVMQPAQQVVDVTFEIAPGNKGIDCPGKNQGGIPRAVFRRRDGRSAGERCGEDFDHERES